MTKITLKHPINVGGQKVSELTLRRPKVRDLKAMDTEPGQIGKAAVLVRNLAMLSPEEVDEIDGEDFSSISETLGDFLGSAPGTL